MLMLLLVLLLTGYMVILVFTHPIKSLKVIGLFILALCLGILVWTFLIGGLAYVFA